MKTTKIHRFLLCILIGFTIASCIEDGNFELPNIEIDEPTILVNSSITAVKAALKQEFTSNNHLIYTFREGHHLYLEAYVISSDATGNFYKKIVVQDATENPTAGLEIILNKSSSSETYDIGRKIYILLDGLSVAYDDGGFDIDPTNNVFGKYILGTLDGTRVDDIPSTSVKTHLIRSNTVETIKPTIVNIEAITEDHINTMIQLPAAQFLKSDLGKTFAGEAHDLFDGFRNILECGSEKKIPLQTSTFASYKSNVLPEGKGAAKFILSKDFRAEFLVAIINSPADLLFTDSVRCDPPVLECPPENTGGHRVLLNQDFEAIFDTAGITAAGWTNVNINGGATLFTSKRSRGNRLLEISGFRTGENPLEVWLISPEIDLETTTNEELTFDTNTGYDNGEALTTYISLDYSGDIAAATWLNLEALLSEGPSSGLGSFFTSSGALNISCLSGEVFIAFKYEARDGGVTTTFQVDNVKITGI